MKKAQPTGKFLSAEDRRLLSDIRMLTPIVEALFRVVSIEARGVIAGIQQKYQLDPQKFYEIDLQGEIFVHEKSEETDSAMQEKTEHNIILH